MRDLFERLTSANHQMGSCELTENNIVAHDRCTESPAACQVKCREEATSPLSTPTSYLARLTNIDTGAIVEVQSDSPAFHFQE